MTMKSRYVIAAGLSLLAASSSAYAATLGVGSLTQESADMWRASKLPGVDIYGSDSKKVGDISDVLIGKDGKPEYVIVGVGGFLGIGQKDIAVPFDQVKFTDQPIQPATANTTGVAPAAPGVAPSAGAGVPASGSGAASTSVATGAPATPADSRTAATHSVAYPDHGMIEMTADQLKAAPSFQFAK